MRCCTGRADLRRNRINDYNIAAVQRAAFMKVRASFGCGGSAPVGAGETNAAETTALQGGRAKDALFAVADGVASLKSLDADPAGVASRPPHR